MSDHSESWPVLRLADWADTCATLRLWTQIVGKVRLGLTPWLNHSWHVVLMPTVRGLTTTPMHEGPRALELELDFVDHLLVARTAAGDERGFALEPMPTRQFLAGVRSLLGELGFEVAIHDMPSEIPDAIPFSQDTTHAAYDREAVARFHRVLLSAHRVLARFRTAFLGKCSPVHFFWGSFDLAVTRFSGRPAPRHPGGFPHLPDAVTREAYSHEVSSAGFWPGGGPYDDAAFYAYAYPLPDGAAERTIEPPAFWSADAQEWFLPYEAVRNADDADATVLAFLQSTYAAAADAAGWERAALECELGRPGVPRPV